MTFGVFTWLIFEFDHHVLPERSLVEINTKVLFMCQLHKLSYSTALLQSIMDHQLWPLVVQLSVGVIFGLWHIISIMLAYSTKHPDRIRTCIAVSAYSTASSASAGAVLSN
jgi:hypothetical protein